MSTRDHGTVARYKMDGCRCAPCAEASRAYDNRRYRLIAYGRWQPYVDAGPVRDHLRMLAEHGVGYKRAAESAGLAPSSVAKIIYGAAYRGMGPSKRVRAETAAALLAVRPCLEPLADTSLTDGTGTRRRLQALVAAGWSQVRLAARLGMTTSAMNKLINREQRVYAATARAAAQLFDELWDQPPPESGHRERISASRARTYAAARGWVPALAWDDIDDPAAAPDLGEKVPRLQAIGEDAAELEALGYPRDTIAARLGVTRGYVVQALTAHHRRTADHEQAA